MTTDSDPFISFAGRGFEQVDNGFGVVFEGFEIVADEFVAECHCKASI